MNNLKSRFKIDNGIGGGIEIKSSIPATFGVSPVCLGRTTRSKFGRTGMALPLNENTITKPVKILWRRRFVFGIRSYD